MQTGTEARIDQQRGHLWRHGSAVIRVAPPRIRPSLPRFAASQTPEYNQASSSSLHTQTPRWEGSRFTMTCIRDGIRHAVVGILLLALSGCGSEAPPPPPTATKRVEVLVLKAPATGSQRSFSGQVRAARRVDLSFNVPGRIVELSAVEGAPVEKGALLARLDDTTYQSRLKAALAEFNKAEANYKRAVKLLKSGDISQAEYDQLKASREVASARVATARKLTEDTRLTAPFSGLIAKRIVENFTEVKAKQPVVTLEQVDELEIVVDVPELYVARKKEGGPVQLMARFDAFPGREFPLTVKEYATQADPKTGAYRYVTVMKRPDGLNLFPGMTATVVVRSDHVPGEGRAPFIVPVSAVFAKVTPDPLVWVVDGERRVHKRKVRLGRLTGTDEIEIMEGLKQGDTLVVQAVNRLREGMAIQPLQKGSADES